MPEATQQKQDPKQRPASQITIISREEFEKKHPEHKAAREKAEKQQKEKPPKPQQQAAPEEKTASTTTTGDVIRLCDGNDNGYRPQGLPSGYSWYKGDQPPMDGNKQCPAGWSSATAYWVMYPEDFVAEGKPNQPWGGGFMYIKDCELYLHKKTGGWDRHQDGSFEQSCARMDGPQTGNNGYALPKQKMADGSWRFEVPPLNYCNHGWPEARASFDANKYDHAFSIMKFKVDPGVHMVIMGGVDWWQSEGADYPNNMGTGVCAWEPTNSDSWTEIYCTQMLVSAFEADPPPGVTKGPAGGSGSGGGGDGGGGTDPVPPVTSSDSIEISVDGNVLGDGSMVTFKVKKAK